MTQRNDLNWAARSLDTGEGLKLFVFQYLFDRAQTVGALRMTGGRQMVQAGSVTEENGGHRLDLNTCKPSWKCLSRFCAQTDAIRRWNGVRHEEVQLQWLARVDAILIKITNAFAGEECVVDQEVPCKSLGLLENSTGGLSEDSRLARAQHHRVSAEQVPDRGGGDRCARPQGIDCDFPAQFACKPQNYETHAELRHRIRGMWCEPFFRHIEGRGQHEYVRVR